MNQKMVRLALSLTMYTREGVIYSVKLSIRQPDLVQLIQTVSKAVAVRTTKQVLSGILLQIQDEVLTATAYDLELGIQATLHSTEDNGLDITEPGAIVLPARVFSDVIRKLPSKEVVLQVHKNYMTEIRSGQAEFHLHGIDAAEFPQLPAFHGAHSIQLPSDVLKDLIKSTAFAAANSEVRQILTGIHVICKSEEITFMATDGLRLATRSARFEQPTEQEWNAIIPSKSLLELIKLLPDDARPITMQLTYSHSLFVIDDTFFYTRLIEGTYPDTTRIVPATSKTVTIVHSDEIEGAIDRAALIARDRENHMIRLELKDETITVSSSSPEIGNVSESLLVREKTGEDLSIAFNARYVLDALRAMMATEVSIQFNGSNQPFTIIGYNSENGLQLISPVLMR